MDINLSELKGKAITVIGLKGSGKTVWVKYLLDSVKKHLIVDPMLEYQGFRRYIPKNRSYSDAAIDELEMVAGELVVPEKGNRAKVDLFAVDEANRYCAARHPLSPIIMDINDFQRHWDLTTVWVARRPTQLNTDLVELSNWIIVFNLAGKNDHQYLNDLSDGLGDAVLQLPKYHYMFVKENRQYEVMPPVPLVKNEKKTRKEVKTDAGDGDSIRDN
jgi:hypothetical protein